MVGRGVESRGGRSNGIGLVHSDEPEPLKLDEEHGCKPDMILEATGCCCEEAEADGDPEDEGF